MGMTKQEQAWSSDASDAEFERHENSATKAGGKAVTASLNALGPAYAAQCVAMGALGALIDDGNLLAANEAYAELGEWLKAQAKR